MADEWYRTADWDIDAQRDFEARLARARLQNRPQYLRLKAQALRESGDPAKREEGRSLFLRVVNDYPESFQALHAHELLAQSYRDDGMFEKAEEHFKLVIELAPETRSGTSGVYDLTYAEMLLDWQPERIDEVKGLLTATFAAVNGRPFPVDRYRYNRAQARVAAAEHNSAQAAQFASAALEMAALEEAPLRWHPEVGLVHASQDELDELRRLAASA